VEGVHQINREQRVRIGFRRLRRLPRGLDYPRDSDDSAGHGGRQGYGRPAEAGLVKAALKAHALQDSGATRELEVRNFSSATKSVLQHRGSYHQPSDGTAHAVSGSH
jgi:hypothetical protein